MMQTEIRPSSINTIRLENSNDRLDQLTADPRFQIGMDLFNTASQLIFESRYGRPSPGVKSSLKSIPQVMGIIYDGFQQQGWTPEEVRGHFREIIGKPTQYETYVLATFFKPSPIKQ